MFKPGHVNRVSQFLIEIHFDAYLCWLLTLHNLCRIIYRREHSFPPLLKWLGLTGLQEALQLYWADELLPVVRPAGNDAQQLLGYNNTQRVWQVGLVNSGDEEWAAWLHTQKRNRFSQWSTKDLQLLLVMLLQDTYFTSTSHLCSDSEAPPGSWGYL